MVEINQAANDGDKKSSNAKSQRRIETPRPSEVLEELFVRDPALGGYKVYKESLVQYQEFGRRIEAWEKKKAELENRLDQLSESNQRKEKEKLRQQIREAKAWIEEYENRRFEMEAKERYFMMDNILWILTFLYKKCIIY